jgi:hypothetical protein
MTAVQWIFFAACALAALGLVVYFYRRRETPGRGRMLLAALRGAALVLLILLLFDPRMPALADPAGSRGRQVLLDASLSMELPAEDGGTRWDAAVGEAAALADERGVILFGDAPRVVPADSLDRLAPSANASRLLPALEAAAEAGVRRVVVLTDGGIEDGAEVARWLARLGLDLETRTIDGAPGNRGLTEVEAPSWAKTGEPVDIRFGVVSDGQPGDSLRVSIQRDGAVLAQTVIPSAGPGRVATGTLRFTPTAAGEAARYEVALAGSDGAADDDARTIYLRVSDDPAGVVLVSFLPDWEPRFLLPLLERALGLPVAGYLRAGSGDFVRTGTGLEAGARTPLEQVRAAVGQADLLVLHGYDRSTPAWATEALSTAPRVLLFPGSGDPDLPFPLLLDQAVADDWYLVEDLPASPVASLLAGIDLAGVPPLTSMHRAQLQEGVWAPLHASRGRRGAPGPLAVGGATAGRRWVVAMGTGYWRWAFRGGAPKQVYDRLWGALGGWLVQEQGAVSAAGVRPLRRIVPRGGRTGWAAPGLAPDSIAVTMTAADGTVALDTVLAVAAGDTVAAPAMAPGHYSYHVRAIADGATVAEGDGPLTVERYSPEFTRADGGPAQLESGIVPVGPSAGALPGRPLHAAGWPYIVLIVLIATEWVLRRRWGLR